ncbi:MAG: DNA repair protein RadC [Candidatus Polarisedimenticolaceae bacterium]|nr:DNA repair protein RadC [Candidatus Polarisedimenticolaceae bacterium]
MLQREFNFYSLLCQESDGKYRLAAPEEIIKAARQEISSMFQQGQALTSPDTTRDYLQLKLAHYEHEVFCVLWLDNRHRVIAFEELFRGTIDGASVYAREVVKSALQHNAAACIFCHNHPSGIPEPSQSDKHITQRLKDALSLVEVRSLDHIIVGEQSYSFAEHGLI